MDVQIRIGLNFGEVVVRAIGSDLHLTTAARIYREMDMGFWLRASLGG